MTGLRFKYLRACLFLSLFAFLPCAAQADKLLDGKGWVIGPITAKAENKRSFCSMKNAYGDLALVIARDTSGANSLAVEFTEKSFAPGAQQAMALSAGPVERQLTAVAATNKVIIGQLGLDSAFMGALAAEPALNVVLQGKMLSLSLAGSYGALKALGECLTAVDAGDKPKPVHVAAETDEEGKAQARQEMSERTYLNTDENEMRDFSPASLARADMLQAEVDRLKARNRVLMLENQRFEAELLAGTVTESGAIAAPVAQETAVPYDVSRLDKRIAWPKGLAFEAAVANYISTEAARCKADFAHKVAPARRAPSGAVQEAEIACMGGRVGEDYAAALLFVAREGAIDVIVHEGNADLIAEALLARDAALASLVR